MFRFVKQIFVSAMMFFSCNLSSVNLLEYVLMNNQECKVRSEIANVNSNESVFYPFNVKTSKCSGSCNNINDPYAKFCVLGVAKNLNVKVFNLMSRTNERRDIEWHETYECKCRLDASVCNNKERWNEDKCRCECKGLIDKGVCDKGFIWNPSNSECECDKSCDVGEYLEHKNCKCRKKSVDKLVEECIENVHQANIAEITENKCKSSCKINVVIIPITFTIYIGIGTCFVYSHWYLKNDDTRVMLDTRIETTIY